MKMSAGSSLSGMIRMILIAGALLAGGAFLTVAVAWASAASVNVYRAPLQTGFIAADGEVWRVRQQQAFGAVWIQSQRIGGYTGIGMLQEPHPNDLARGASFVRPSADYVAGRRQIELSVGEARGWPLLAMWIELAGDYTELPGPPSVEGGIVTTMPLWTTATAAPAQPRIMPLRPLWPGFAFNVLIFSGVLALIFVVPSVARRAMRRRQARCPGCGYPVGTSRICCECGAELGAAR